MTELGPTLTKLRMTAQAYRNIGDYEMEQWLLDTVATIVGLEIENAKLRELLLAIWNDAMQFDGFWDYVHDDGEIYREDELPHYQERMRELGVEVDG